MAPHALARGLTACPGASLGSALLGLRQMGVLLQTLRNSFGNNVDVSSIIYGFFVRSGLTLARAAPETEPEIFGRISPKLAWARDWS